MEPRSEGNAFPVIFSLRVRRRACLTVLGFSRAAAQGLAHIGALKAAEVRRLKFLGVAGTSAGSIVAALIAAGWHSDELYDPLKPVGKKGRFELDFLDFFDRRVRTRLIELKADAEKTFSGGSPTRVWCRAPQFYFRNRDLLDSLSRDRGSFGPIGSPRG